MTIRVSLLIVFFLAILAPAVFADTNILAGGNWYFATPHEADATFVSAIENGSPADSAVAEVTVTTPSANPWDIQIIRGIPGDVPLGDRVRLHFWAKSMTRNPIRVALEQAVAPYVWVANTSITLMPTWTEYTLLGTSPGFGKGGLMAQFQLGASAGTIEINGETAVDTGPDPALADAESALTPDQTQERIEKYREGSLTIKVVGADGLPLSSVNVRILQTRHAFLFGCNLLGLNPLDSSPGQITYQKRFSELFNYGNLPFFWDSFESTEGKPDYARLDLLLAWCNSHEIATVGHPLLWQYSLPSWLPSDPDQSASILKAHVQSVISHYKDSVRYWVVINEANSASNLRPANGESAWVSKLGAPTAVETALDSAKEASNGAPEQFIYNDFELGQPNVDLLTKLKADGKLPDVIGIQSHMHSGNWPLTQVWEVCQTYSKFGKPIHFTETTVLSGPNHAITFPGPDATDWNSTADGEEKQAEYVEQSYTVLFSHPDVRAISWWDLSDRGAWMGAPAGLLRKDMTPKPAYIRLMNLIHKTWWTDVTVKTDKTGNCSQRVFYGDYTVTVTTLSGKTVRKTISFAESAPPMTVTVRL